MNWLAIDILLWFQSKSFIPPTHQPLHHPLTHPFLLWTLVGDFFCNFFKFFAIFFAKFQSKIFLPPPSTSIPSLNFLLWNQSKKLKTNQLLQNTIFNIIWFRFSKIFCSVNKNGDQISNLLIEPDNRCLRQLDLIKTRKLDFKKKRWDGWVLLEISSNSSWKKNHEICTKKRILDFKKLGSVEIPYEFCGLNCEIIFGTLLTFFPNGY